MKVPEKVINMIIEEAIKNASFSWYQGWEKSSGYIKSRLNQNDPVHGCRIYIKWEKKKEPNQVDIDNAIKSHINNIFDGKQHISDMRDFRHYLLHNYFVDVVRLKHEAIRSIIDNLPAVIDALEKSKDFESQGIQHLLNDLRNLDAGICDHEAIENLLITMQK